MRLALLTIVACANPAPVTPWYPMHPLVRSASGGPVQVVGEVARPGEVPYAPGMTLSYAIEVAGGPTGMARERVRVVRDVNGRDKVFQLSLRKLIEHRTPDPELAPGDIVIVESIVD